MIKLIPELLRYEIAFIIASIDIERDPSNHISKTQRKCLNKTRYKKVLSNPIRDFRKTKLFIKRQLMSKNIKIKY